uniref:BRO1 domain-containing protein n=1 Tax=Strigamia maritima TaxID=126957 RepID=T1JEE4_STRMM
MVAGKQAVYLGITEYYQSQVAKSQKLFGEALSRLQHSIKAFTVAESRFSKKGLYTHWIVKVQKAFDETKKDNDFIYHEDVSNVKDLPLIDKAALAKPIPPGERLSTNFKDMFGSCAQTSNVNASLAANDMTKTSDVNREMEKLSRTMTRETTTIREEDSLVAIQRNKAKRMLDQEQKSDIQLQFQERCMSMTSEKVPKLMRLNHTILLSKSEHELAAKAPSANDLESSSTVSQLRGIMEAVEANKAEQTILAKDGSIPFFVLAQDCTSYEFSKK